MRVLMQSNDLTGSRTSTLIRRKPGTSGHFLSGYALIRFGLSKNFCRPTELLSFGDTNPWLYLFGAIGKKPRYLFRRSWALRKAGSSDARRGPVLAGAAGYAVDVVGRRPDVRGGFGCETLPRR